MLCYVMLCYVLLCFAMLYLILISFIIFSLYLHICFLQVLQLTMSTATTNANVDENIDENIDYFHQPVTYTRYQEDPMEYYDENATCEICDNVYPLKEMCKNTLKPDTNFAAIALGAIDQTLKEQKFPEDALSIIQSYLQPIGICVYCDECAKECWDEQENNKKCWRCGVKCDMGFCDMCDNRSDNDDDDDGNWDFDRTLGWRSF